MAAYPRLTHTLLMVKRLEMHIISQENKIAHLEQQLSSNMGNTRCVANAQCVFSLPIWFSTFGLAHALHCTAQKASALLEKKEEDIKALKTRIEELFSTRCDKRDKTRHGTKSSCENQWKRCAVIFLATGYGK